MFWFVVELNAIACEKTLRSSLASIHKSQTNGEKIFHVLVSKNMWQQEFNRTINLFQMLFFEHRHGIETWKMCLKLHILCILNRHPAVCLSCRWSLACLMFFFCFHLHTNGSQIVGMLLWKHKSHKIWYFKSTRIFRN